MKTKHIFALLLMLAFSSLSFAQRDRKAERAIKQRIEQDSAMFDVHEVTQRAEFPKGGQSALNKFLAEEVRYPYSMAGTKTGGFVVVSFVVEQDGLLTDIQILKSPGIAFDEEVIRVMGKMPRWTPAKLYYKDRMLRVRTRNQLTVEFEPDMINKYYGKQ